MKTVMRALISLCLIVWIGGELFFPVVAALAFGILAPDTHTAGRIVGSCLRVLHYEGMVAGALLILFIILGSRVGMFCGRKLYIALVLVVLMLALTAVSQFGIIPRMETYRVEAGGAIDTAALDDPARVAFEHLHRTSENVEEAVLFLGLVLVGFLAASEESSVRAARL